MTNMSKSVFVLKGILNLVIGTDYVSILETTCKDYPSFRYML